MPNPLVISDPKVMMGKPVVAGTRITVAIPPRPQARASVPAHNRRVRSFSAASKTIYFAASIRSLPMPLASAG